MSPATTHKRRQVELLLTIYRLRSPKVGEPWISNLYDPQPYGLVTCSKYSRHVEVAACGVGRGCAIWCGGTERGRHFDTSRIFSALELLCVSLSVFFQVFTSYERAQRVMGPADRGHKHKHKIPTVFIMSALLYETRKVNLWAWVGIFALFGEEDFLSVGGFC